jgi:3-hydroxyacyl-CoA dehydrogenase
MHFLQPLPVLPLVEIAKSLLSSQEALLGASNFAEKLSGLS